MFSTKIVSKCPAWLIRLATFGIRSIKDFRADSACPSAQLSSALPDANIKEITEDAKYSPINKVPTIEKIAKMSEPIWRSLMSSISHLIDGISPVRPPNVQINDAAASRSKRYFIERPQKSAIDEEISNKAELLFLTMLNLQFLR